MDKVITIKDIASKTGFSKSTVSRVLCNDSHVKPETREKILALLDELGFEPNYFAKGLKTKTSKTIAFFVPNIEIMIYPAIIQAMEVETRKRGYLILLCDIQEDKGIAKEYVRKLKGRNVDGFIFSTAFMNSEENEEIQDAISAKIPCVNLLRTDDSSIPSIHFNNFKGSEIGVEYLIRKGKKKIAYLQGQQYLKLYQDRLLGYKETLKRFGYELNDDYIWYGYDGSERVAREVVREKIKSGLEFDAIFCSSENLAVDAITELSESGLKVPDDVAVLGYDNVPISELFIPHITTISQPFKEMGKKAVDVLINLIEGKGKDYEREYVFDPVIIERDTV